MSATGWFLVALIVLVAAVLAFRLLGRAASGRPTTSGEVGTVGLDDGARAEIHRLLAADRKIQAIKVYRERTGAGLRDAKVAVESLERGESLTPGPAQWDDLVPRLTALKNEGQAIAAIKLLRERTGLSLLEAKNAVDRL
ncbi:hypothetical protein HQ325_18020 [Rhodococcus sp. BP-349]|uniref:hypothetical protein n=1 Tax=unclassified Rhodococcus (in: high G+C Gram-positive bacteria) TaxID=192944 RepID=UPI001C9ABC7F|nr:MULTISPECIES: hypothetical protein [unclassified Rhodococcus (in: high G+C Gram-positive bacteria)]MBY6540572.1 hypothetical protein [Rhodococcus sp. BP-363]MBY6545403.1 hypothetical protein [Rhodococcus sp. BP-369]MBY6564633.1 hypothetical protein [Rhodococcus sp. BP-370]MBY6578431.1 hypothetical protein [Rhodococcus sp. BP-364]MBY6587732.1 hypothetical protein [Rhodococcus sp. BP-358]